jgi:hypothetical protein
METKEKGKLGQVNESNEGCILIHPIYIIATFDGRFDKSTSKRRLFIYK